ncbi:MAG: hypothetical protein Q3X52_03230 [Alistipes sp.]|uniref:hypothetical protein n=1 Tax=Alistipes sp. TaxID=1872444 RepID=UPI002851901C|nr:hypothetical protein [Alistipes sp.]MDR3937019.1 hypothetical protein [Alistipes sp.]
MMKRFNLLVYVYRGINTLEEKFTRKNHPDYTSDLSKHILIVTGISIGATFITSLLRGVVMSMLLGNLSPDSTVGIRMAMSFLVVIPFLCCVAYWIYYLKRHLYLFSTTGQKIGYGLFTCVMLAILGPSIYPLLIALILLSIAISIALFLLSVVMTIIALFDGGGSKKRRFSLDNGDKVTEKTGFFGEKYYEGRSGKSYETNDNGRTFSEK